MPVQYDQIVQNGGGFVGQIIDKECPSLFLTIKHGSSFIVLRDSSKGERLTYTSSIALVFAQIGCFRRMNTDNYIFFDQEQREGKVIL